MVKIGRHLKLIGVTILVLSSFISFTQMDRVTGTVEQNRIDKEFHAQEIFDLTQNVLRESLDLGVPEAENRVKQAFEDNGCNPDYVDKVPKITRPFDLPPNWGALDIEYGRTSPTTTISLGVSSGPGGPTALTHHIEMDSDTVTVFDFMGIDESSAYKEFDRNPVDDEAKNAFDTLLVPQQVGNINCAGVLEFEKAINDDPSLIFNIMEDSCVESTLYMGPLPAFGVAVAATVVGGIVVVHYQDWRTADERAANASQVDALNKRVDALTALVERNFDITMEGFEDDIKRLDNEIKEAKAVLGWLSFNAGFFGMSEEATDDLDARKDEVEKLEKERRDVIDKKNSYEQAHVNTTQSDETSVEPGVEPGVEPCGEPGGEPCGEPNPDEAVQCLSPEELEQAYPRYQKKVIGLLNEGMEACLGYSIVGPHSPSHAQKATCDYGQLREDLRELNQPRKDRLNEIEPYGAENWKLQFHQRRIDETLEEYEDCALNSADYDRDGFEEKISRCDNEFEDRLATYGLTPGRSLYGLNTDLSPIEDDPSIVSADDPLIFLNAPFEIEVDFESILNDPCGSFNYSEYECKLQQYRGAIIAAEVRCSLLPNGFQDICREKIFEEVGTFLDFEVVREREDINQDD